ncbi:hypothetical protein BC829DRAFT_91886 [Chytridium lagenaria]|nr:hypothetical protein BC829DRAFT_91886 [Chytridium lagenaria]
MAGSTPPSPPPGQFVFGAYCFALSSLLLLAIVTYKHWLAPILRRHDTKSSRISRAIIRIASNIDQYLTGQKAGSSYTPSEANITHWRVQDALVLYVTDDLPLILLFSLYGQSAPFVCRISVQISHASTVILVDRFLYAFPTAYTPLLIRLSRPKSRRRFIAVLPGTLRLFLFLVWCLSIFIRLSIHHGRSLFLSWIGSGVSDVGDASFPTGGTRLGSTTSSTTTSQETSSEVLRQRRVNAYGDRPAISGMDGLLTDEELENLREQKRKAPNTGLDSMFGFGLKHGGKDGGMERFGGRGRKLGS